MDFLPLARDPIDHGRPTILPVFSDTGYDGGPFLGYLDRHPNVLYSATTDEAEVQEQDIEIHYQNWLFFGLLAELLGDLFDEDDFLVFDERLNANRITTGKMRKLLRRWKKVLPTLQEGDPEFSHFRACFEEKWRLLEHADRFYPGHGPLLGLQIDVIAAVAEAFCNVLKTQYADFEPMQEGHPCYWFNASYQARRSIIDEDIDRMMEVGGWCRSEAQRCITRFGSVESWYYFRHLKLREDCSQHTECSALQCFSGKTSNAAMVPRHVGPGCRCESFHLSSRKLTRIYKAGFLPCLEIKVNASGPGEVGDMQVRVRPVPGNADDTRYVALSHAWADGTGNGHANALPLCHLKAFHDRIVKFHETREVEPGPHVLLWVDTLCCPYKQGEGKRLALTRMKDIYRNAAAVHVWDRSLLDWECHEDYVTLGTKIMFSTWSTRLWTAQEAIFAGRDTEMTLVVHCQDASELLTWLHKYNYHRVPIGSTFN